MRCLNSLGLILCFIFASIAVEAKYPNRPTGNQLIMDYASVITPLNKSLLERKLTDFRDSTGVEILLVTLPSIETASIHNYAINLAKQWEDDGVMSSETVLMIWEKSKHQFGLGPGTALKHDFPISVSEKMEDRYFAHSTDINNGLLGASESVMGIISGNVDEKAVGGINSGGLLLLLFFIIFFLIAYPIWLFKEAKRTHLGTKPINFSTALSLKYTFGGGNFSEFRNATGPFGLINNTEQKGGGGAGGVW